MYYNPWGRLVLGVVIVLSLLFLRFPRKHRFVYPLRSRLGKRMLLRNIIWIIALISTVIFSYNIQRIDGSSIQTVAPKNIMFLLDGSLSMSASDIQPNRFSHANQLISQITQATTGSDHALIVFSGIPLVRIPWSSDASGFSAVISGLTLGDFPATNAFLGTALGDALLLSLQQFASLSHATDRALVIISDGDSNKGYDPYKVLGLLHDENIPVYFIAIGEEGYEVGKDRTGLPVVTSFDTELMKEFTDKTQGRLYRNPEESDVAQLSSLLSSADTNNSVIYKPRLISLNQYVFPILIICFSLLLLFSMSNFVGKLKKS